MSGETYKNKCDNLHCFKKADVYSSIIFMKPSQQKSYIFCEGCYKLVTLTIMGLVELNDNDYATVAQSGRAMV